MQYTLNHSVPAVPSATHPVYWDRMLRLEENLLQVQAWIGHYRDKLPKHAFIDEVAILVPDYWHRARLSEQLRSNGWAKFAEAEDLVFTNPFGTRYCVEYAFFQKPLSPFRIEVMMLVPDAEGTYGFSPLHQALWVPGQVFNDVATTKYPMPHLSFKMPGNEGQRGYGKAVQHIRDRGCLHAMTCQSTYGSFGYFIGNETQRQIYLKPRVNMRDAS